MRSARLCKRRHAMGSISDNNGVNANRPMQGYRITGIGAQWSDKIAILSKEYIEQIIVPGFMRRPQKHRNLKEMLKLLGKDRIARQMLGEFPEQFKDGVLADWADKIIRMMPRDKLATNIGSFSEIAPKGLLDVNYPGNKLATDARAMFMRDGSKPRGADKPGSPGSVNKPRERARIIKNKPLRSDVVKPKLRFPEFKFRWW